MKKQGLIILSLCICQIAFAQKKVAKGPTVQPAAPASTMAPTKDELLFTYGKDSVFRSEFERIYSKNNNSKEKPDEKSIKEYLDLYVNFKLKVKEARALGLDTMASFRTELAGYRKQLAQPYLVDKKVSEQLVKEAYERMKYEVNASHILVNCAENALPKDTQVAYAKIMDIRKKLLAGELFDSMAVRYSEDPSVQRNYGNLGWFSAFQMIYSFENGAYTTKPGDISYPLRTRFGYHLIKVIDRRPARGEVKVAHIMIKLNVGESAEKEKEAKDKIDAIYAKLKTGEKFEEMVKQYSQDENSVRSNGEMNWFSSTSNFPAEFKEAAFALKNKGDFSEPLKTQFGWHIIRLVDRKELAPLSELEETIKMKVSRDTRSELNRNAVVERIKKENNFKENLLAYKEFRAVVDSSLLEGHWNKTAAAKLNKPIFSLKDKNYTQQDFANYINDYQATRQKMSIDAALNTMYKDFVMYKVLEFEEDNLDKKYEDFRNLMQEYRDGILLFDLTDKKVWSKAVNDSSGLESFYNNNKNNYMWKERYVVLTFICSDEKTRIAAEKMLKSGKSVDEIKKKLNAKNPLAVDVVEKKIEKGEDTSLDQLWDKVSSSEPKKKNENSIAYLDKNSPNNFSFLKEKLAAEPKAMSEVKGLVTADYQSYLEKTWLKELKDKYPVMVNAETAARLFK